MILGPDYSRDMKRGEEEAVEALLKAAFGGEEEARLVRQLRKDRVMAGEMVLPFKGEIVGYYALSQFVAPKGWLCLAPVAIHPDVQGRGYGRRMIGLLSAWAKASGQVVVVLGQTGFYERSGFSVERAAGLKSPYPIEHTLLVGPGEDVPEKTLIYPKAFEGL